MKNFILSVALLSAGIIAHAQQELAQSNKERLRIDQTGFVILSSWSFATLGTNLIGLSKADGEARYFRQMNAIWGGVNLLIAVPAYIKARRSGANLALDASIRAQASIEKIFILNVGLDLAYLGAGAWLLQKADNNSNPDKYRGYGKSVLLQGGFLLLFDAVMFTVHNQHGKKLYKALSGLQLAPNSIGFNLYL